MKEDMMIRRSVIIAVLAISCLSATLLATAPYKPLSAATYNLWGDINNDGKIDGKDIAAVAKAYDTHGTNVSKAALMYDSGWIDIRNNTGQFFDIVHNLGITGSFIPRVWGKTTIDGPRHQRCFDETGSPPGWSKTYGGTNYDDASAVVQTDDEGYAIAGNTWSYGAGGSDFYLVKTDANGNLLWNKTYGGANDEKPNSLIVTSDDGYAIAGSTLSYGAGASDSYLVKTDSAGNMLWNRTYGFGLDEVAYSVIETSDGGYALAGCSYSLGTGDFWLVKTNSTGHWKWMMWLPGSSLDVAHSLVQTSDGGYVLAGYTWSYGAGYSDYYLVKINSGGGAVLWNKTYGGTGWDEAWGLIQTNDGGFALSGYTGSFGAGGTDFWLVKTDSDGNMQWNKTYGGADYEETRSLIKTVNGGYAMAGFTMSYGAGGQDFYLVKTDGAGNVLWSRTYGGSSWEFATSLIETADGGYAMAGLTYSYGAGLNDFYLVKTDPFGLVDYPEVGLAITNATADALTFYRGKNDPYWNYIRVYIWIVKQ